MTTTYALFRPHALLPLLLLALLPGLAQAQFNYTTNNGTITITGHTGPDGEVVIPPTINGLPVTSIGYRAFYGRTDLTSVTIPNSVTDIGGHAFNGCTGLTSVAIPNSVIKIGFSAFFGCTRVTSSVTIGNSVTNIEVYAFYGCLGLTSIAVDPLDSSFAGLEDVLFNKSLTSLVQYPGARLAATRSPTASPASETGRSVAAPA
jgi:BspA type Leucine rich repeat region (6 copies)